MEIFTSVPSENLYFQETTVEAGNAPERTEMGVINVFDEFEYQSILGFGGAFTESAAYNYAQLTDEQKKLFLYIWGGGWNGADEGSGVASTQLGISPRWLEFASEQDESYDFNEHRFERENGLDCSGYVGWVLYNTFEKEDGKEGYVTFSTDFASSLAQRGWGKQIENPKEFLPADIVSMEGHVWICLGTCSDGSVLLVHSSPPGVSVCGTSADGKEESIAIRLATEYMIINHPEWQKKYPNREVVDVYLENVTLFRWNKAVMLDAEEFQGKSAEEIMEWLSP